MSEELASRMILVEGAGNKTMEEEVLNESAGCVLDNFSSSKDINKTVIFKILVFNYSIGIDELFSSHTTEG